MGELNLESALLIILCIDAFLVAGQFAVTAINPDSHLNFFSQHNSTLIEDFNAGNYTDPVLNQNNSFDKLPTAVNPLSTDLSSIISDPISTAINWFANIPGIGLIFKILGAPIVYMSVLGLPFEFVFLMGAIWYGITLFLLFKLIVGR